MNTVWTAIKTQQEADKLVEQYCFFHDSCIRDIYISSGTNVFENRSMGFDKTPTLTVLFQQQARSNSVLELKFEDRIGINYGSEFDSCIFDATIRFQDGLIYWTENEIDTLETTWICGEKLFWRFRPELTGDVERLTDI